MEEKSNLKKAFVIIVAFIGCIFLFSITIAPASAATYLVNSTTDATDNNIGDGICATASSVCTLRAAIQEANSDLGPEDNSTNDTITLPAETYALSLAGTSEDESATGDLDLTDTSGTLTINGAGSSTTIIDANDIDRVMHTVGSTTSIINNVTLTDGTTTASGAGIQALGTTTLNGVVISNNAQTGGSNFGGGIRCDGNTLTITDSTISGNTTQSTVAGGAINGNLCNLTITDSLFSGNTSGASGGAMYLSLTSNTIRIEDTTFSSNSASGVAGAIYFLDSGTITGSAELRSVTFTNNTGGSFAGALYTEVPTSLNNTTFTGNAAAQHGGAIYVQGTDAIVKISFSTIAANTANTSDNGSDGGGIFINGSSPDVVFRNSILYENTVGAGSGPNCFAASADGVSSSDYNLFENITDCALTTQANDATTASLTNVTGATLASNGGSVQTMNMAGTAVTDIVPPANCLEADGVTTLSRDARGMSRPQSTNCDRGAYEKDQTSPTVTITSGTDTVQCATGSWTNAGATATDNFSTGLTASTGNTVNVNTLGVQTITYTSTADVDGNTGTNTRTVTVVDTTGPTITVTGSNNITHEAATTYTDAGATATDSCDSTITVTTAGSIATTTLGAQTLTYSASDDSSNAATQKTRTVTVVDTTVPVITRVGEATVTVANGATYTDAGATATDSFQGNLTANIVTTNPVNTAIAGTYTVTYNVSDLSGNAATAVTRTVTVEAVPVDDTEETEDDTTDDPEETTEETEEPVEESEPIVTTNGKYIIVTVDGVVVDRMKVNRGTLQSKYYALTTKSLYQNYTSVILLTTSKTYAQLTVARLTAHNQLTKKTAVTIAISERTPLSLAVNRQRDRITVSVGSGNKLIQKRYHLTKTGQLHLLR